MLVAGVSEPDAFGAVDLPEAFLHFLDTFGVTGAEDEVEGLAVAWHEFEVEQIGKARRVKGVSIAGQDVPAFRARGQIGHRSPGWVTAEHLVAGLAAFADEPDEVLREGK